MIEKPIATKDIAPKKEFHFPGSGIYIPTTILATVQEEAEKIWRATRKLVGKPEQEKVEDISNQESK